jgi:hypothetical protein
MDLVGIVDVQQLLAQTAVLADDRLDRELVGGEHARQDRSLLAQADAEGDPEALVVAAPGAVDGLFDARLAAVAVALDQGGLARQTLVVADEVQLQMRVVLGVETRAAGGRL